MWPFRVKTIDERIHEEKLKDSMRDKQWIKRQLSFALGFFYFLRYKVIALKDATGMVYLDDLTFYISKAQPNLVTVETSCPTCKEIWTDAGEEAVNTPRTLLQAIDAIRKEKQSHSCQSGRYHWQHGPVQWVKRG